ncbi:MAG: alpha/beta hydrolase [Gammaproteobacteria bacterium]|nr:alpha/beta hydrolase [Gammaproteobacteria bacterium]
MPSGAFQYKFKSAWWLPEGHSQTLWRKFAGSPAVNHVRERVELSDGDFIDIDWLTAEERAKNSAQPLVFILHGLCGSSSSSYVLSLQTLLIENGFNSVVMNFRGCSGELNRKAQAYHSGVSHDLEEVLRNVIRQHKPEAVSLVGYSLGANVLLKWLGEHYDYSKVDKAVAVSTPFTLGLCSREMLSGLSRIYGRYFTRRLLSDYLHKRKEFELQDKGPELEELLGLGDVSRVSNIWEFDDQITAPLHGFESANDYYGRCSSIKFLPEISASTLLIQSYDDPLVPPVALPEAGMVSESTVMELSPKGGHVGFVSAQNSNWLEHRILKFLRD